MTRRQGEKAMRKAVVSLSPFLLFTLSFRSMRHLNLRLCMAYYEHYELGA